MPEQPLTNLTVTNQVKQRKQLLLIIKRRRTLLQRLVLRNETLKVQLEMLQREYKVKIGSLIVKDEHLDLDIIRFRNVIGLMEQGKTYAEAIAELSNSYLSEQLDIEREEENIRMAEEVFEKGNQKKSEEIRTESRKLWRKLLSKFHPDLTQDSVEKKRREGIMKQINIAYEEGDIERLEKIDRENTYIEETSLEGLEEVLEKTENEIIEQEKDYLKLQMSEWYKWNLKIRNSKKTLKDIFADTEKKLLNDIVAKFDIIKELKQRIEILQKDKNN